MTFSKEFKEAIQNLASGEKDKLILRLLKHDLDLVNRLHFELVSVETIEDRRAKMQEKVSKETQKISDRFYSMGYLMMDIRSLSGSISEHVRITKDKFGEASLNLQMLIEVLTINKMRLINAKPNDVHKLNIYLIAKVYKIMLLIHALHEDYLMEFREQLEILGTLISEKPLMMKAAIRHGLDVNWLISGEIPENIVAYHKELRGNGFLK